MWGLEKSVRLGLFVIIDTSFIGSSKLIIIVSCTHICKTMIFFIYNFQNEKYPLGYDGSDQEM